MHITLAGHSMVRKFLLEAGYDILPPTQNCIAIIPELRRNMPRCITLALDVELEMLFPGNDLVGLNHRANQTLLFYGKLSSSFGNS